MELEMLCYTTFYLLKNDTTIHKLVEINDLEVLLLDTSSNQ